MAEKKLKPYEIGELDHYLFGQGNHYEIYKKLGAHKVKNGKKTGVYFAVWLRMHVRFPWLESSMSGTWKQTLWRDRSLLAYIPVLFPG